MSQTLTSGSQFTLANDANQELRPQIPAALHEKIQAIETRKDWKNPWTTLDENCLTQKFNKFKNSFQTLTSNWIQWHIKIMKTVNITTLPTLIHQCEVQAIGVDLAGAMAK